VQAGTAPPGTRRNELNPPSPLQRSDHIPAVPVAATHSFTAVSFLPLCRLFIFWVLPLFSDLIDDFDNYSPQPDKFLDVPFVPTDDKVIEAMLNLAQLSADDVLYDLGSGDGRIVVAAARDYGASSV